MKIYVINLDRRPDRREAIAEQLAAINLSPTWISAIDGQTENFEKTQKLALEELEIKRSELACYLSHLSALRLISASKDDYAVVLEDDAILAADFLPTIISATKWIKQCPIIRLSALRQQTGHMIDKLTTNRSIILPTKSISGTQGYIVSRHGASTLARKLQCIKSPIDTTMDRYWRLKIPIAAVTPPVVTEDRHSMSDVAAHGRRDVWRDHRPLPRIKESLRKRLTVLRMLLIIKVRL